MSSHPRPAMANSSFSPTAVFRLRTRSLPVLSSFAVRNVFRALIAPSLAQGKRSEAVGIVSATLGVATHRLGGLALDLGHVESSRCWRKRDDQDHGQEELLR